MIAEPGMVGMSVQAVPLVDGCGRRVDHLRLSVTSACDLRCVYCRPWGGHAGRQEAELSDRQRLELVRFLHMRFGLSQVRITGGEPLVYRNVVPLIRAIRAEVPGVTMAITTNGRLLAQHAAALRSAGLDRINISVDALDPACYRRITGGDVEDVLGGIEAAVTAGFDPPKINTVVLRHENDGELVEMVRWAVERGCEIRFLEVMPIGPAAAANRRVFMPADEMLQRLAASFPMVPLPRARGSTARRYRLRAGGRDGIVGFIAPVTDPFCSDCRRMRVTADGRLYPCLLDDRHVDLTPAWSGERWDGRTLTRLIESTVEQKVPMGNRQATPMIRLGG